MCALKFNVYALAWYSNMNTVNECYIHMKCFQIQNTSPWSSVCRAGICWTKPGVYLTNITVKAAVFSEKIIIFNVFSWIPNRMIR